MWDANFTGVPVEGLSGLVHEGYTDTKIQQQQRQKLSGDKCQGVLISEVSRNLFNHAQNNVYIQQNSNVNSGNILCGLRDTCVETYSHFSVCI
jgi:hypothetical protein